jgi:hypothetical protein
MRVNVLITGILALCSSTLPVWLPARTALDAKSIIRRKFDLSEEAANWRPNIREISWAERTVRQKGARHIDVAASAFCLAMAGHETSVNVRRMVASALQTAGAETEFDDGVGPLASALEDIFERQDSNAALQEIESLWLDGGPGESLANVRQEMFLGHPTKFSVTWLSLSKKRKHNVASDLAAFTEDNQSFTRRLRSWARKRDAVGRLSSAILHER